jgi:DNA adenine methylase
MQTFLRWVGSKKKHTKELIDIIPKDINTFYDPFVGGGSLLFFLKPKHAVINDINTDLMDTYRIMSDELEYQSLVLLLRMLQDIKSEQLYYQIRDYDKHENWSRMNKLVVALRFIFLNRTSFKGIHRINEKGFNNVPVDHVRITEAFDIVNIKELDEVHQYLKHNHISIHSTSKFEDILKDAKEGDFVVLDPPYHSQDQDSKNIIYYGTEFTDEDQKRVADIFKKLTARKVKFIAFNYETDLIKHLYEGFEFIYPKRKLTLKKEGSQEVFILNYISE